MKHLLIAGATLFALAGCESRLDQMRPHNKADEASYLVSFNNVLNATAGLYSHFLWNAGGFTDSYFYTVAYHVTGEFRGNNVVFRSPFLEPAELNLWCPDAHFFLHGDQKKRSLAWTLWARTHQVALGTSKNIVAIDKMLALDTTDPATGAKLTRLKGENLFLRGLIYFNAVNAFGRPFWDDPGANPGIPLDTLGTGESLPRASVRETFRQVIADFGRAARLLPDEPSDRTYANRAASYGMLSRVYLYMGGTPGAPDSACNALAARYADSTFALQHDLVALLQGDAMKGVFDHPKRNSELLFSFYPGNCDDPVIANVIHDYYSWGGFIEELATSPARTPHSCVISRDYAAIMDTVNDLRWVHWTDTSAYHPGRRTTTKFNGGKRDLFEGMIPGGGYFLFQAPLVFLRAAEVILNRAEARAKLGEGEKALADLNAIRARAGLKALTGLSGRALFDAIFLERRRELAFEAHVYYDYTRNGLTMKRDEISTAYPAYAGAAYNEMNPRDARRVTCAIPAEELLLNPLLRPNE
ncbi:MAG: RagB/SusD family nutrient uptake outer membrane protein [Odoribacteraceae bacterium]|jgi:hypothetical protein|nr:RagB/SusD family nutrient uptake outer membrane protein [Odoribacteraceae bacterium]